MSRVSELARLNVGRRLGLCIERCDKLTRSLEERTREWSVMVRAVSNWRSANNDSAVGEDDRDWAVAAEAIVERDRLREALRRIAYEPQGAADASHRDVLEAVERIAKEALEPPCAEAACL